jgi:hypothetical protein
MSDQQNAIGIVHDRECVDALSEVDGRADQDRVIIEYARRMSEMYREWE